jgi:hypothetical protein
VAFEPSAGASLTVKDEGLTVATGVDSMDFLGAGVDATTPGGTATEVTIPGGSSLAIGTAITSATAGSVLFVGAAGVLAQDNANFFWDDTNNRLGLGLTAPLDRLHIEGTLRGVGQASSVLTGSIDPTASTSVTGVGTAFLTGLYPGDRITVSGLSRNVLTIASDTSLVVDSAFTNVANDTSPDKLPALARWLKSDGAVGAFIAANGSAYFGINNSDTALGAETEVVRFANEYAGYPNYLSVRAGTVNSRGVLLSQYDANSLGATILMAINQITFSITGTQKAQLTSSSGQGLLITAGTATTDVNALNITQTWNDAADTFTAIELNVTNTASAATSLLMDLQVGGASMMYVRKDGAVIAPYRVYLSGDILTCIYESSGLRLESGASSRPIRMDVQGVTRMKVHNTIGNGVEITPGVATTGSPSQLLVTGGAHTTLTASAEAIDINFNLARTVQFATGALTTQRAFVVQAPTYGFVGASTITDAATFAITGAPVTGTNATITNAYALWVQAGLSRFDGNVSLAGNLILSENSSVALDPAGSADGKYTGTTVTGTAGAALAFGDLIYLDPTDSRWELCDANAASGADGDSRGIIGMCVLAAAGDGSATTILLNGILRADTAFPAMTINAPFYVSETAGDITSTAPTTTDAVVRTCGYAITADELYFNPASYFQTAV